MHLLGLALGFALLIGNTSDEAWGPVATTPGKYGLTSETSVEVCKPPGERQYLARLVCPSGAHPECSRTGSVGPRTPIPPDLSPSEVDTLLEDQLAERPLVAGAPDYHWIDAYEVRCETAKTTIYLEMYHCDAGPPDTAPEGFSIVR